MTLTRVLTAIVLLAACANTQATRRFTKDETAGLLKKLEVTGLDLGEFPIDGASAVIDGDTIRVKGLSASMRLLGIDTEETFKHDYERELFAQGWEAYKKKLRGSSARPVKMATPVGDEAKDFAKGFFQNARTVKLERDHPGEIRDFYGRYLAYVFAKNSKGEWVNYNVECVRAGYAPYFMKYGRSRRFHDEFVRAQDEARAAQRGIWKPGAMHYDDYDERLKWWGEREAVITRFEKEAAQHPDTHIALTRWDAMLKLEQRVGKDAAVLGSVQEVKFGEKGPSVVKLARSRTSNLDVIFFDKDVLLTTGLQFKKGEYVVVKANVTKYKDARGLDKVQLVVSLPGQVLAPSQQLEEMLRDTNESDSKSGSPADDGD